MSKLIVGIADMKMSQNAGELITYALGSCIGICLFDPAVKVCALIHIMLPLNMEPQRTSTFKYADTAIPQTLKEMEQKGASRMRITAKIAGGASMFAVDPKNPMSNIGKRNIDSVTMCLRRDRIKILAQDVGGEKARTMSVDVATGGVLLKSYGKPDVVL